MSEGVFCILELLPSIRAATSSIVEMSDNTTSAFLGREPNTLDDYYIIKGIYRAYGLDSYNATKGWTTSPSAPAGYVHETEQPAIIAGMVIVMLVIACTTGTRLVLRARSKNVAFGSDDWTIWLAAVSLPLRRPTTPGRLNVRTLCPPSTLLTNNAFTSL